MSLASMRAREWGEHGTIDNDPMLDQRWDSVVDGGPTLILHWVDVLRLRAVVVTLHACRAGAQGYVPQL